MMAGQGQALFFTSMASGEHEAIHAEFTLDRKEQARSTRVRIGKIGLKDIYLLHEEEAWQKSEFFTSPGSPPNIIQG